MNPAPKQPDQSTYCGRFAARLRSLREKTGLTGQQMVDRIKTEGYELGERTYYNWEAGRAMPPIESFPTLARAYGIKSPRELLPKE